MKKRISVTIDPETDKLLDTMLKEGDYRNKSHLIESLIKEIWRERNDKNKK